MEAYPLFSGGLSNGIMAGGLSRGFWIHCIVYQVGLLKHCD